MMLTEKIGLLVPAFTLLISSLTLAESAFEGVYAQVATGYQKTYVGNVTANNIDGAGAYSMNAPAQSVGNAPLMLGLGYNLPVTPLFLLGLGAEYQAISSTSGAATFIVPEGCTGQCGGAQYKTSNQMSLYLAPSYIINADKLAYFKVGYSAHTLQYFYQQGHYGDPANGASFGSSFVGGYVFGVGYKQMIASGLYGFSEANYYNYAKASLNNSLNNGVGKMPTIVSRYNPLSSTLNFLIGLGYRF